MGTKKHYFYVDLKQWALPLFIGWNIDAENCFVSILCFHYHYDGYVEEE